MISTAHQLFYTSLSQEARTNLNEKTCFFEDISPQNNNGIWGITKINVKTTSTYPYLKLRWDSFLDRPRASHYVSVSSNTRISDAFVEILDYQVVVSLNPDFESSITCFTYGAAGLTPKRRSKISFDETSVTYDSIKDLGLGDRDSYAHHVSFPLKKAKAKRTITPKPTFDNVLMQFDGSSNSPEFPNQFNFSFPSSSPRTPNRYTKELKVRPAGPSTGITFDDNTNTYDNGGSISLQPSYNLRPEIFSLVKERYNQPTFIRNNTIIQRSSSSLEVLISHSPTVTCEVSLHELNAPLGTQINEAQPATYSATGDYSQTVLYSDLSIGEFLATKPSLNHPSLISHLNSFKSEVIRPSPTTGWLPSKYLKDSNEVTTPRAIATGLFYAVHSQDESTLFRMLLALVEKAIQLGGLTVVNGAIDFEKATTTVLGFPESIPKRFISVSPTDSCQEYRSTAANARLGIAVVKALKYITSNIPAKEYKLSGTYPDLIATFKSLLRFLAFSVAASVSPLTNWTSPAIKDVEQATFGYEQNDYEATLYAGVFLTESLDVVYDPEIHLIAARLYKTVEEAPLDITSNYYLSFSQEAERYGSNTNDSALVIKSSYLIRAGAEILWALKFKKHSQLASLIVKYGQLRSQLTSLSLVDEWMSLWLIHRAAAISSTVIPSWLSSYWAAIPTLLTYGIEQSKPSLDATTYPKLASEGFDLFEENPFYLYADELAARLTDDWIERQRMWPSGLKWTKPEAESDLNYVLGALLWAEGSTKSLWYLAYKLNLYGLDLKQASGPALDKWLKAFGWVRHLSSDRFLRDRLFFYINRSRPVETPKALAHNFKEVFGVEFSIQTKTLPTTIFKSDPFSLENRNSYETILDSSDGRSIYLSSNYKRSANLTFDSVEVNPKESTGMAKPKLIKRKRPGHLYEYYSFDDGELRFDTLITTDFNKLSSLPTVVDSPVAVIPYNEYYSTVNLSVDSPSLDGLDAFFQANLATGVLVNLNTTRDIADGGV